MADNIEGIYAAYMTGKEGAGFAMFIFVRGRLIGVDPMGVNFEGTYQPVLDGGHIGKVSVNVPPGGTTVQGVSSGESGISYEVEVTIPPDFLRRQFISISTPLGPVNVSLKKVRDVDF